MKRRRYIASASVFALLAVGFIVLFCQSDEPSWNGQRLSAWLAYGCGAGMTHEEHDREEADLAIRQIGTNALPLLMREIGAKHSAFRWRLVQLAWRLRIDLTYPYPDERRARALGGFQALGSEAAPALPQLRALLDDPEVQTDAHLAIDAILNPARTSTP